ncbi:MAG: hypothetical protein GTO63_30315 [Anaerolineae bacterium]|nr:hypothetical protein [Anaerolineae bacterium]NIN99000.1 hypothetical protein [Anaerolineae bacterium]
MRKLMLRLLKADHQALEGLLESRDSRIVQSSVVRNWSPDIDDRNIWPRVYAEAETRGVEARGWKLRFLMYYWAGVQNGDWD